MEIKNSTFIVTGGSSGLGAATVEMVVSAGGNAIIADVNKAQGEALAAKLGKQARYVECDVTREDHGKAAVAAALKEFGGLHALVNCAGIAIGINLIGTFNMIRLAADAMSKLQPNAAGERGVIINTASVAAFDGQIGQAAYAASKGGIVGMTLPIARDLSRSGIRVMTIAPGIFETPMLLGMPQDVQDALGKMVPFPSRLGRPKEYAQLVRHIAENEMLNGEVIRLDGAIRMQPK